MFTTCSTHVHGMLTNVHDILLSTLLWTMIILVCVLSTIKIYSIISLKGSYLTSYDHMYFFLSICIYYFMYIFYLYICIILCFFLFINIIVCILFYLCIYYICMYKKVKNHHFRFLMPKLFVFSIIKKM